MMRNIEKNINKNIKLKEFFISLVKYVLSVIWIVGFTITTAVYMKEFKTYINFGLFSIIILIPFLSRHELMFISGISAAITQWILKNYQLSPWYFIIYGIAAFIAHKYIVFSNKQNDLRDNSLWIIPSEGNKTFVKNNIYMIYSLLTVIIGTSLLDLLLYGKLIFLLRFPIHIIEVMSSGILASIILSLYIKLKLGRHEYSPKTNS